MKEGNEREKRGKSGFFVERFLVAGVGTFEGIPVIIGMETGVLEYQVLVALSLSLPLLFLSSGRTGFFSASGQQAPLLSSREHTLLFSRVQEPYCGGKSNIVNSVRAEVVACEIRCYVCDIVCYDTA